MGADLAALAQAPLLFTQGALGGLDGFATSSAASAGGTAPSCIHRLVVYPTTINGLLGTSAKITNNCGHSMRIQVVWKRGWDSPCTSVGDGNTKTFYAYADNGGNRYDRTAAC